ncbi:hypothetical protein like AT1G55290 [Hibiscus trionum]|uniref:Non-haem dioxygenase N-terminal domain-containing protein n=1 Tax=Hibiscus trionum TaxID=183268 RepID=A0A9W7JB01_HIBTR|nr:hypothetical protein like AT1G55290 [Hibiscus trionum]
MAPTRSDLFNDSSDFLKFVINQKNGVKGLSELGLLSNISNLWRTCMTNVVPRDGPRTLVLENVKDATYRFFKLPAEVKNKYSKKHSFSNNVRFGTSFTPQAEKALEWKDYLSFFYVSEEEAYALWPSVCMEQVLDYMKEYEVDIKQLLQALMKGLNVDNIDNTKESLLTDYVKHFFRKSHNKKKTIEYSDL